MTKSPAELFAVICGGEEEWLLLFDIDGTLIDTGGKGMRALMATAGTLFGGDPPPLDLAGATDLGVLNDLYKHYDVEPEAGIAEEFFKAYHPRLKESLEENTDEGRVLGYAEAFIRMLNNVPSIYSGLLTGNTEEGARIKLEHYGLGGYFGVGAFGSDHADRNLLGQIALERVRRETGKSYTPGTTLVIGDTPRDVASAHAFGARCLAVATGKFSSAELEEAGADWVVESLSEVIL